MRKEKDIPNILEPSGELPSSVKDLFPQAEMQSPYGAGSGGDDEETEEKSTDDNLDPETGRLKDWGPDLSSTRNINEKAKDLINRQKQKPS